MLTISEAGCQDASEAICKECYKKGLSWAGRGTIPVNELA